MFSQLLIGYPSLHQRRPMVLERRVIARSPILLTPFTGDWNIEAGPLKNLVDATFREAGLAREDIDTGAVIITGEAARRDNAQKIAELFSDEDRPLCLRDRRAGLRDYYGCSRLRSGSQKPRRRV